MGCERRVQARKAHPCFTVFLQTNTFEDERWFTIHSGLSDDDQLYVVKMAGNPEAPMYWQTRTLGSVISGAADLSVAQIRLIYITDRFIDSEPDI